MSKSISIGFIGLGSMGKPMAENLIKAGYSLTVVYHRNKAPAEELAATGARITHSIQELAESSEVVVTILPKDEQMLEVYTAPDGLLAHLKPGAVCIEMTSSKPDTVKAIQLAAAEKGIQVLDAPVSGGVAGAQQGTLSIMVGGDRELLEDCRPILEAMGSKIFYTGEVGSGKAIKMINQLLNAGNTYIASEALYLARQLDLDLGLLTEVIQNSSGDSFVFRNAVSKFMVPERFEGGFKLDLMTKDIRLNVDQADDSGIQLPISSELLRIYEEVSALGFGDNHYAVVSEWIKRHNHTAK
jgi:3-hydroxyisobutyrate dehydrogenase-like beta-hydroxyacid dehydrogenase